MRLLVCGGAGFIGSNFVRQRLVEHGDAVTVLDKLTYAGRQENLQDVAAPRRLPLRARRHRGRGRGGRRHRGRRRRGQLRRRDARGPLDRRAGRVHPHARHGHLRAARGRPGAAASATCRCPRTRSTARSRRARSPRPRRSPPPPPTPPPRPARTSSSSSYHHTYGLEALICRGSNNYGPYQYPEKLIPLMVLNALHGDPLPVYGDGHAGAQLDLRGGLRPRHRPRARARACPGRPTTSAAPTRRPTSTWCAASSRSAAPRTT